MDSIGMLEGTRERVKGIGKSGNTAAAAAILCKIAVGKQGEGKDNGEIGDTSAGHQALLMLLLTEQSCSGKVTAEGLPDPCLVPLS